MLKLLKIYINNKKKLGVNPFRLMFGILWLPIIVLILSICILCYSPNIEHSSIASALLSALTILASFLIFSTTIIITKENNEGIRNNPSLKYKDVLLNNILFSIFLSVLAMLCNLAYVVLANSFKNYHSLLLILCSVNLSLISTILTTTINDLLLLIKAYEK